MATNTPINYSGEKIDYHQIQLAASRIEALLKALDLADATEQLTEKTLEDLNAIIQTIIDWDLSDDSSEVKDQLLNIYNSMVKKFKKDSHGIGVDVDGNENNGYAWFANDVVAGDVSLKTLKNLVVELQEKIGDLDNIPEDYGVYTNLVDYVNDILCTLNALGEYAHVTLYEELQDNIDSAVGSISNRVGNPNDIPADYSNLIDYANAINNNKADTTYVDEELAKKQDKDPVWEIVDEVTLTEDVEGGYHLNLRDSNITRNQMFGAKMIIEIPKDKAAEPCTLIASNNNYGWIQNFQTNARSANTAQSKIITVSWVPRHGYYEAYAYERTGASLRAGTLLYCHDNHLIPEIYLDTVRCTGMLYAGTKIKVWGLIRK